MDSIFSHQNAGARGGDPEARPPATTVEVTVPRDVADAFAGFTDGIHLWWPVTQTHFGEGTHPEFTDGVLFEEDASGRSRVWGTVLGPPSGTELQLAWHHRGNPDLSSHVSISFTPAESGTRLALIQDGWAAGEAGAEQRAAAPDWQAALFCYRRFMGGA
jgi:hypothetical protein